MRHVLIPFKDEPELTISVLDDLLVRNGGDWDKLWLLNNGSKMKTMERLGAPLYGMADRAKVLDCGGMTLTQMWNLGWRKALEDDDSCVDLVILNNDVRLPQGFCAGLLTALRSDAGIWATYPDYRRRVADGVELGGLEFTSGTWRHGGMSGWAFGLKAEKHREGLPLIDEQFEWWCGDDDLAFSIEAHGGKVARVNGLPIDHIGGATFDGSGLHSVAHEDLMRCDRKWGRRR